MAWSILGSPGAGLINVAFRDLGMTGPVNMYSYAGVIMVFAMYYAPYAFLLIHGSMSLMNPDLEDASGVHGASPWRTITSVSTRWPCPPFWGRGS